MQIATFVHTAAALLSDPPELPESELNDNELVLPAHPIDQLRLIHATVTRMIQQAEANPGLLAAVTPDIAEGLDAILDAADALIPAGNYIEA